jgi:hypothetical protein
VVPENQTQPTLWCSAKLVTHLQVIAEEVSRVAELRIGQGNLTRFS